VLANDNNRKASFVRRVKMSRVAITAVNTAEARLVHREVLRCQLADALQKAIYAADGGDVAAARKIVDAIDERVAKTLSAVEHVAQARSAAAALAASASTSATTTTTTTTSGSGSGPGGAGAGGSAPVPLLARMMSASHNAAPISLVDGLFDKSDPFAVWLEHALASARLLFVDESKVRVARHVANAALSALALEHASHWTLPSTFLPAEAVAPPTPRDPYEHVFQEAVADQSTAPKEPLRLATIAEAVDAASSLRSAVISSAKKKIKKTRSESKASSKSKKKKRHGDETPRGAAESAGSSKTKPGNKAKKSER